MEQLITTVACLLCAGFGMAAVLTIQSMATAPTEHQNPKAPTPQGQEQAPATDDRQAEQQTRNPREMATQWENLLNYTGGSRGVDHE